MAAKQSERCRNVKMFAFFAKSKHIRKHILTKQNPFDVDNSVLIM